MVDTEEKFKEMVFDMRVGVLLQGPRAEILLSNPAALELLGLTEDQLLGKTSFDPEWKVIHEDGSPFPGDTHPVPVAIATRKAVHGVIMGVYRPLSKDNVWLLVDAIPQKIVNNTVEQVVCTFIDITGRKEAELALEEKGNEIREINLTKDKLFSIIAHDLRSPFNIILGFSQQLLKKYKSENFAQTELFIKAIESSAKSTLILLDNLLNWQKSQTGQLYFNPVSIKFKSIEQEIDDLFNSTAAVKNISLDYFYSEEIVICADKDMLLTILRNLITNALKFTNEGGKIAVFARVNSNQIEITVSDNGIGISEDVKRKIFKIDSPVTQSGTSGEIGTGLGLILCKEFVDKHGGKIWVESVLGKGCDVKFTLPI
jgi:two-component system sensor histidine kinase/response regulator